MFWKYITTCQFLLVKRFLLSFLHFLYVRAAILHRELHCKQTKISIWWPSPKKDANNYFYRAKWINRLLLKKQGFISTQNKFFWTFVDVGNFILKGVCIVISIGAFAPKNQEIRAKTVLQVKVHHLYCIFGGIMYFQN